VPPMVAVLSESYIESSADMVARYLQLKRIQRIRLAVKFSTRKLMDIVPDYMDAAGSTHVQCRSIRQSDYV